MLRLKRGIGLRFSERLPLCLLGKESTKRVDYSYKPEGGHEHENRDDGLYLVNRGNLPRWARENEHAECQCNDSHYRQQYSHKKTVTRNADSVCVNAREFSRTQKTAGVATSDEQIRRLTEALQRFGEAGENEIQKALGRSK